MKQTKIRRIRQSISLFEVNLIFYRSTVFSLFSSSSFFLFLKISSLSLSILFLSSFYSLSILSFSIIFLLFCFPISIIKQEERSEIQRQKWINIYIYIYREREREIKIERKGVQRQKYADRYSHRYRYKLATFWYLNPSGVWSMTRSVTI